MATEPSSTQLRLARLPERHLAALRAALAGFGDDDIAGLLGIPVVSVPTTMRVAAAKLVSALDEPEADPPAGPRESVGPC
jgi:DNA-directed RNA polymerase specialized sigma24 family protein